MKVWAWTSQAFYELGVRHGEARGPVHGQPWFLTSNPNRDRRDWAPLWTCRNAGWHSVRRRLH